ncbi:MAG: hypothetical protein IH591_10795 [Bacteroidales bacterium]|nr:hypothetical protein [Bacteroidales bacterium]
MSLMSIIDRSARSLSNIPGWRTKRRFVIIESDDWGSLRMPSRDAFTYLTSKGIFSGNEPFSLFETLASSEDLSFLFETLHSFKDINGNTCVLTAACIVANPDFKRIREHDFSQYYYEPFTLTLERYYPNDRVFEYWKKGIEENVFRPQFHGREHLNVAEWMRALQVGDYETRLCFDKEVWAFKRHMGSRPSIPFQAPFDYYLPDDLIIHSNAIKEGLILFSELFGYKATFFVPPNGPYSTSLEKISSEAGITLITSAKIMTEPLGFGKSRKVIRWLGQKNRHNQRYSVRNAIFEPVFKGKDWVDSCLSDMAIAFKWNKPAIISSHRANYIGVHDIRNRDCTLRELKKLLSTALKRWPNIEFITSDHLDELMNNPENG